jgi:preprotein translocase subunit SecD
VCRAAALALLLAAACRPEGGVKLVYAHGADASVVAQRRLKTLMIRSAHVVVEGETLAVYVPGGRRLEDVKAALSKRGALDMSLVVETGAMPSEAAGEGLSLEREPVRDGVSSYVYGRSRDAVMSAARQLWPNTRVLVSPEDVGFRSWVLDEKPLVTGANIADATDTLDQITTAPAIDLLLDDAGKAAFAKGTAAAVGRRLAIVVDDEVKTAPVIMTAISNGRARLTLGARAQLIDARALAAALKSGPLPQALVLESEAPYAPRGF